MMPALDACQFYVSAVRTVPVPDRPLTIEHSRGGCNWSRRCPHKRQVKCSIAATIPTNRLTDW
jgi:hypothetical protein